MLLLVLNSGSSSLKYALFAADGRDLISVAEGVVERIGETDGDVPDCATALARVFSELKASGIANGRKLVGIGHRVVHGGESFDRAVLIDDRVLSEIRRAIPLAPLHNSAAIAGIEATRSLRPDVPQVAVFDTAFHQTIPPHAFRYALPAWCYQRFGLRRYGMHGPSHAYVSRRASELLGRNIEDTQVITLHLGNGASVAAVSGGRCIETSMGVTPLEGLIMGTRSGDLDPAVPLLLCSQAGMTPAEVDHLLNYESGLRGLCGENDMRAVLKLAHSGNADAELALSAYCHRIRKYIGAYAAVLGRLDALVFTAGIGENAAEVRRRICTNLDVLGLRLDEARNLAVSGVRATDVATDDSRARILVIPTDEAREIAVQMRQIVLDAGTPTHINAGH